MSDVGSVVVHGVLLIFGLFGISVSVILMNTLLFIGSAITFATVGYSAYMAITEYYAIKNKKITQS
jgi:hypothetical protein